VSVAFSAVVLLLIFLPGFILRRVYLSYPFSRKYSVSSPFDDVPAILIALVLQGVMIIVIGHYWHYEIDYKALGVFLVGAHLDQAQFDAFANIRDHFIAIAEYNLVLWAVAAVLGFMARWLVVKLDLDLRFRVLRFSNDWYYLLTGRQWFLEQGTDFDFVWLDLLVETGGSTILYSGRLHSYFLAPDGGLDSICLADAQKWMAAGALAPISIPGQGFIMKYSETVNLNIVFMKL
jgi:hypothetical protein